MLSVVCTSSFYFLSVISICNDNVKKKQGGEDFNSEDPFEVKFEV
jgi:hypothetical protein